MVGVSRLLTFKRIALSIAVLLAAVAVAGKLAAAASSDGPSASFTYSPTSPLSGEDISFSSTSSDDGTLTQLQWEFDDGGTGAEGADVNHTYEIPGVYTVQLTVTDDEGLSSTAQDTITVQNRDPAAGFHWSPDLPLIDETVFFNSDASDPEDRIEAEKWDLDDDGAFDDHTGSSASRSFSAGGTYTISLLVEDKDGGSATISRTVDVIDPPNQKPNANFTFSPTSPQILDTVTFDSTSTDTDGSIATMEWDFDNDGLYDDATGDKPTRMFFLAGTYTIGLLVTDNEGETDTVTKNVTVSTAPNDAPVAAFHFAPSAPKTNEQVTFTSDATDDGTVALEEWDFENDGTYDAAGSEVQHSYPTAGSYTAKLRVTDDQDETTSATKTVNVTEPPNDPPTPAFGFSPNSPQANALVTFTSTSTDDGAIASTEWDFTNDGTFDATGTSVQHAYAIPKAHTVRLRVTDDNGVWRETTRTVTIPNQSPTADFTFSPSSPQKGQTVNFSSLASDPENRVLSITWDLDGDAQYDDASGLSAAKAFPASGNHPIGLTITDQDGGSDTITKTVVVANQAPVASFEISAPPHRSYDPITFTSTSTDPDGNDDIVDIDWDVDLDGFDDGSGTQVERTFTTSGAKTVRIRVTDLGGASSIAQRVVNVENLSPTAKVFSYSPPAPLKGQSVSFDASSSTDRDGSLTNYEWDFNGDGVYDKSSSSATTTNTFQSTGLFVVRLRVTDNGGATDEIERGVTVGGNKPPTATITVPTGAIMTLQSVMFSASSSDSDGSVTKHEWDLDGDGNYDDGSKKDQQAYTYLTPGPRTIGLKVTDDDGATGFADTKVITVGNRAPTAVVTVSNATPLRNETITLDASGSTDPDPVSGLISKVEWDLNGDGDYTDLTDKLGAIVTHRYTALGPQPVNVRVTDTSPPTSTNRTATKALTFTVRNSIPTATFAHNPASPSPNVPVELTATGDDTDGTISKYEWDLDGNGSIDKTGTPVTTTFKSVGTKTVTLRVTDNDGGQAAIAQPIVVGNRPPVASFDYRPSDPVSGQQVTLFSNSSDPDNNLDHSTAEWDLDADGVFETPGRTVTNVFGFPGSYTVSLRIRDTEDEPSIATQTIVVRVPAAPRISSEGPQLRLLSPFPIVRIAGRIGRTGTRFRVLSVSAPAGATVTVKCRGRGCPFKASSRSATAARQVRIRKLERRLLRAGASIKIFVTKPGSIGKYTSIRIRGGKPPRRSDRCLMPDSNTKPVKCPS